jgi:hypothetical protein
MFMIRQTFHLVMAIPVLLSSGNAQPSLKPYGLERGIYYRSQRMGYEMWVPTGFCRGAEAEEKEDLTEAIFRAPLQEYTPSPISRLTFGWIFTRNWDDPMWNDRQTEHHSNPEATVGGELMTVGGRKALLGWATDFGEKSDYYGYEKVNIKIYYGRDAESPQHLTLIWIRGVVRKGKLKEAIACVHWMLGTFRWSGDAGLDPFLRGTRVDRSTGLLFRPPLGFEPGASDAGEQVIYAGVDRSRNTTVAVARSPLEDLSRILAAAATDFRPEGEPWEFPAKEAVVIRGARYRRGDRDAALSVRRVVAAVELEGHGRFAITAEAPDAQAEYLIRTVELIGQSIEHVDVSRAEKEVAKALDAVAGAARSPKPVDVTGPLDAIARFQFVEGAIDRVARCFGGLRHDASAARAASILGGSDRTGLAARLTAAVGPFKQRGCEDALLATLRALGTLEDPTGIPCLLQFARRGNPAQAAEAVCALGCHKKEAARVAKEIARIWSEAEAGGKKASARGRARWESLDGACRAALLKLTGRSYSTPAEARKDR